MKRERESSPAAAAAALSRVPMPAIPSRGSTALGLIVLDGADGGACRARAVEPRTVCRPKGCLLPCAEP